MNYERFTMIGRPSPREFQARWAARHTPVRDPEAPGPIAERNSEGVGDCSPNLSGPTTRPKWHQQNETLRK